MAITAGKGEYVIANATIEEVVEMVHNPELLDRWCANVDVKSDDAEFLPHVCPTGSYTYFNRAGLIDRTNYLSMNLYILEDKKMEFFRKLREDKNLNLKIAYQYLNLHHTLIFEYEVPNFKKFKDYYSEIWDNINKYVKKYYSEYLYDIKDETGKNAYDQFPLFYDSQAFVNV